MSQIEAHISKEIDVLVVLQYYQGFFCILYLDSANDSIRECEKLKSCQILSHKRNFWLDFIH